MEQVAQNRKGISMVRTLKPLKERFQHPDGWGMFPTEYSQKEKAERHANNLRRDHGYEVAVVKSPKGWNVCTKTTKKSLEILKKSVWGA